MEESKIFFSVLDYGIFFFILIVSFVIGIFAAFKGNKSPEEFLLGNRALKALPVSMSLLSSFISVVNLVGFTTEIYLHGTQLSLITVGVMIGVLSSMFIVVPVIYPLKLTSIHEYIDIRFNSPNLQVFLMVLICINGCVFIGVSLYAASVALSMVTPFDYTTGILVMGIVCTIYSTVGGIRAVVWTDVFQLIVMVIGMLIYIIAGVIQVGGFGHLLSVAEEGQRLQFFNMNPSIYERHNFYNTIALGSFFYGAVFSVSQINTQRICAVGTLREANKVLIYAMVGFVALHILVFLGGLVVYASYAGCDPVLEGKIQKYNQVLSYFILDKLSHIYGLPGIYAATMISSTLSSFSSCVNALVAIIWRDLLIKFQIFSQSSPIKCALINKILTFICGAVFIGMAFVTAHTKSIIQLSLSFNGINIGLIFGVFLLGICFPKSNKKGAITGMILTYAFLMWIYFGSLKYGKPPDILPMSTEACPLSSMTNGTIGKSNITAGEIINHFNSTVSTSLKKRGDEIESENQDSIFMYFYGISYTLYVIIGPILVIIIGVIASYLSEQKDGREIPRELIFQWSRIFPQREKKFKYSSEFQKNHK